MWSESSVPRQFHPLSFEGRACTRGPAASRHESSVSRAAGVLERHLLPCIGGLHEPGRDALRVA